MSSRSASPSAKRHCSPASNARLKTVVLGANGFLGSVLLTSLFEAGHDVVAFSRRPPANLDANISGSIQWIYGDVREKASLQIAMHDADIVFHTATATHPTLNVNAPRTEIADALLPVITIMESAIDSGVRKLVFPSSGGTVYPDIQEPRTESMLTQPLTPYAVFKNTAENVLLSAADRHPYFSVDVMRIANLYGPGQKRRPGQGVLPHWFHSLRRGEPLVVFGDGEAKRDYVLATDAAKCLLSSCSRLDASDIFNVGTGQATSLNDLVKILRGIIPTGFEVRYQDARPTDLYSVSLCSDKLLSRMPGFQWTGLETGLTQCWQALAAKQNAD